MKFDVGLDEAIAIAALPRSIAVMESHNRAHHFLHFIPKSSSHAHPSYFNQGKTSEPYSYLSDQALGDFGAWRQKGRQPESFLRSFFQKSDPPEATEQLQT